MIIIKADTYSDTPPNRIIVTPFTSAYNKREYDSPQKCGLHLPDPFPFSSFQEFKDIIIFIYRKDVDEGAYNILRCKRFKHRINILEMIIKEFPERMKK